MCWGLGVDLYIIAMHGMQGKLYRDLKTPIQQLKRFMSRLPLVQMENVRPSEVPYSDRNYPNASMYRPIFRTFRHLMCVNHQGEFDLETYQSRLQYEGLPANPAYYMTPEDAAQFNALSYQ